jgi:hypothetical protein
MRLQLVLSHTPEGEIRVDYIGPDRTAAKAALETPSGCRTELYAFIERSAKREWEATAEGVKPKKK